MVEGSVGPVQVGGRAEEGRVNDPGRRSGTSSPSQNVNIACSKMFASVFRYLVSEI